MKTGTACYCHISSVTVFVRIFQKVRVDYAITFNILYAMTIQDNKVKTNSRTFFAFSSPLLFYIYSIRAQKQRKRRKNHY